MGIEKWEAKWKAGFMGRRPEGVFFVCFCVRREKNPNLVNHEPKKIENE